MDVDSGALGFDAAYTWDDQGRMTGINYGPQYTLTYDANGRLGGMSGSDLSMTASYGVAGEMLGVNYHGNAQLDSYNETRTYNAMLQMTQVTVAGTTFTPYTQQTVMDMQYVYAGGANNGRITRSIDGVSGETVNYTYDAVNRLATAGATNGTWGQGFTYDGFGNLTGKTVTAGSAPTMSASFAWATNWQIGGTYDANGNPSGGFLQYDVENRMMMGAGGETYVYDQAGKRVKKAVGNAWEFYFYGIGGQKLVTLPCVNGANGLGCPAGRQYNVYFGGKLVKSKGVVVATDRLGSVRANSNGERMSYYPYGEEKTSTADGREKFGTYTRDNPGQDYADQRYYAVGMGRFNSADPTMGGVRRGVPATWNKYGYVHGDPINFFDPRGRNEANPDGYCPPEYETCDDYFGGGGGGEGGGGGGGCAVDSGMGFVPSPDPACYAPGGDDGDGGPTSARMPRITLRQVDSCVIPGGTGLLPGAWTLEVKYQVLADDQPVYGSALNALGISISESGANITGNIGKLNGTWCLKGGTRPTQGLNSMDSSGGFWDQLAGSGTADQTFRNNGQVIPVSFPGNSNSPTVLRNTYNSSGQAISVGSGALIGNSSTRLCDKNGDPGPRG